MTIYDNNHHQILLQAKIAMPKSTCDVAIGGLGKKHEVLYENPGFLFMSRENTRYNFIPNKFVGFRRLGYIYILDHTKIHPGIWGTLLSVKLTLKP